MIRAARNLLRLLLVLRTLARHDALFLADGFGGRALSVSFRLGRRPKGGGLRPGQRLAAALTSLGPVFIKFGQALSCRADLVGEVVAADLADLQDRLPPFPAAAAREQVEAELGRPVAALYRQFDDRPVAAASIAQVHFAVTTEGAEAAVKILRPGIEAAFARDIDLLLWVAQWLESRWPATRRLRPTAVIAAFAETVRIEMDLRMEAAAAAELAKNFAGDPDYRVPSIDWQRTARRVLTLERVAGIAVDERQALVTAGHDPSAIAGRAARIFFKQVFRDGFFHADQHPGNLFVEPSGRIVAVDFGIMGRLDRATRAYLAEMLAGFLDGDYARVAEVHFRAGYVPGHKSVGAFAQACRAIAEPILGRPLAEISLARLLALLFQVTETFEMETQPRLLLLQKTMLVVEGVGRRLEPTINVWSLARPLIEEWMADSQAPAERARAVAAEAVAGMESIPALVGNIGRAAAHLAEGAVRLHPDSVRALSGGRGASPWPWLIVAAAIAALVASLL